MLPNSCFWNVWNVHFAVVIRTSSVLIFPNIAKKDFSWQIITSLYREHFWNTFQAKETPCCTPVLREEKAGHWCLCQMIGEVNVGKRQGCLSWVKRHWGWSPYMEMNVWSNHFACNLLFCEVFVVAFCPFCTKQPCTNCPRLCKKGKDMPNLPSPEWRICLKWLSGNGISLHLTRVWGNEGQFCFLCPNYRRSLAVKNEMVDFLSEVTNELTCVQLNDDTIEQGSSQTLVCGVCEMAFVPFFYELALCCFSLLWKRRNSLAKSGFFSKEIKPGIPFMECKTSAQNLFSEIKRQHDGWLPQCVGGF